MATFGAGFVTRPLGGVFFGLYADRRGRKALLELVILLMTLGVAVIGLAPTYASVGLAAPLLIVLGRLLRGFATGGEFATSTTFLVEAAPRGRRGLYGSLQMAGQGLAVMLGTAFGIALTHFFSQAQILDWAWRLPFLFGVAASDRRRRHCALPDAPRAPAGSPPVLAPPSAPRFFSM